MKRIKFTAVVSVLLLALSSCNMDSSKKPELKAESWMPEILATNSDGAFQEDMIYVDYNYGTTFNGTILDGKREKTFKNDGTYIAKRYYYEKTGIDINGDGKENGGYILAKITEGGYSYKELVLTMKENSYTSYFESSKDKSTGEWVENWAASPEKVEYSEPWVTEETMAFTSNSNFPIYLLQDNGSWKKTNRNYNMSDKDRVWSEESSYTLTDNKLVYESKGYSWTEWTMDIFQSFPESKPFESGVTLKFNGFYSVAHEKSGESNWTDEEWEKVEWKNMEWKYNRIDYIILTNCGGFIVETRYITNFTKSI